MWGMPDVRLLTEPAEIRATILSKAMPNMLWVNEGGVFVGPYVKSQPLRHDFQPVAVASKKQMKKGRSS